MVKVTINENLCKGCGLCKFIIVTDDKGIKNIFGIEVSFFTATVNIGKTCFCCSINIRRNFFFGCLIRRYEFDFAFIHAGYFANSNLKEKLILLIKKVY